MLTLGFGFSSTCHILEASIQAISPINVTCGLPLTHVPSMYTIIAKI